METLKLVFYILGSAAFLGLIIFFIALIFNKDDGIDLEQGRINYLSREVDRLDKKIDEYDLYKINTEIKSFNLSDLIPTEKDVALSIQKQQFEEKEKKYVEKIRQLEKILVAEEIQVSVDGQVVANMKADKLKYEKYELNLEKTYLENDVERLKSLLEMAKGVITVTEEDENILDIVDKILAEEKTKGSGYNTVTTLKNKKSK